MYKYVPGWYWDFTVFGDNMRNFNTREFAEGYHSHGLIRSSEDFMGNAAIWQKSPLHKFLRAGMYPFVMYTLGWGLYWHRMYSQNARCPWGAAFDPSKESAA
eukprot:TRINITY_DN644_c0_g2_i1.p2 TRINITY_DN644_c0_g2~~TRINITY_DN644_c0_g2_i1.p2  ORF type:complete len:102 (+),score=34.70 TRINITY_DN644_c0_g2_i1:61-366(+)